jgi:hypothetical protein
MSSFWKAAAVAAAFIITTTVAPSALRADDQRSRTYHDVQHNDDHQWNNHEDQAYKMWNKENHRKSVTFGKLKDDDQQSYWGWRHEHSDAILKINIR